MAWQQAPNEQDITDIYGAFTRGRNAAQDRGYAAQDRATEQEDRRFAISERERAVTRRGEAEARVEHQRTAIRYQTQLETIASMNDAANNDAVAQYRRWRGALLSEAQAKGVLDAEGTERFNRENPDVNSLADIREIAVRNRARLSQQLTAESDDPAETYLEQHRGPQFRPGDDTDFRPGTVWDVDARTGRRYAVQNPPAPRAGQDGPPAPPRGYTIVGGQ